MILDIRWLLYSWGGRNFHQEQYAYVSGQAECRVEWRYGVIDAGRVGAIQVYIRLFSRKTGKVSLLNSLQVILTFNKEFVAPKKMFRTSKS